MAIAVHWSKSETNCQIVVWNSTDINGIRRLGSVPATSTFEGLKSPSKITKDIDNLIDYWCLFFISAPNYPDSNRYTILLIAIWCRKLLIVWQISTNISLLNSIWKVWGWIFENCSKSETNFSPSETNFICKSFLTLDWNQYDYHIRLQEFKSQ